MLKEKFEKLAKRLLAEVCSFYGHRLVSFVIFGSVARETYRFGSDIDVLIVANDLPEGRMKRVSEFEGIENNMESFLGSLRKEGITADISPIFKTPEEAERGSPLFLDMVEDARILYDENGFFADVLQKLRQRLNELGAKRVWRGNVWHWVLKPDYKPGEVFEL